MHSPKSVHAHEALSSSPDWIVINGTKKSNVEEIVSENGNDQQSHWSNGEISEEEDHQGIRESQTIVEDFTIEFFRPLQQIDQKAREDASESIIELLRQSLQSEKKELLKAHISTIVRLATETPFEDVQTRFQNFLKEIEDKSISCPSPITFPSNFIRKSLIPSVNNQDEVYKKIYTELFLQTGRVSHLHRVLAIHPSYLEKHTAAFNFIMNEPGPLPLEWRNYIAILASCRHKCKWLLQFQAQEFILNGGQQKWLDGIDFVPKKLSNLLQVTQILSHQPWLLTKDHISSLVKGEDSWSIGELVHAILIICTFNALSGFVHGCGVTNEVDWGDITSTTSPLSDSIEDDEKVPSNIDETKKLTELLKGGWEAREHSVEQQVNVFALSDTVDQKPSKPKTEEGPFARFLGSGYELYHEDFDTRAKHYSIFKVHEWNWKDDGFELARRFLPGAAALLDEEFDYIYNMTNNMLGNQNNKNIDTFPFRRAIWQYVQRIKGMFHDDYNYGEVNIFLNRSTKSYIKKITCYPETITKIDFQDIGYDLNPDEKVHVALLAVESSKQSALLYGLHAVMKHMYGNT